MGTVTLSSSSSSSQLMVLRRLLRPAPILSFSFLKHHALSLPHTTSFQPITGNPPPSSLFLRFRTFSNNPVVSSSQALLESPEDLDDVEEIANEDKEEVNTEPTSSSESPEDLNDDDEIANEDKEEVNTEPTSSSETERKPIIKREVPSLTVKEKKDLASYAHSLGKKLKTQQVGKSGVTEAVVFALDETLEKNELLKLKVHGSCPGGELEDVVKELEEGTGSVCVSKIGRTVILYRPSVTKMKAEEKKKQNQIAYQKKQEARQSFQGKSTQVPSPFARGRRGSSRF